MRPYRFKLNTNHDLAQGLVFAGLGNVAGSGTYFDSTLTAGHATLQNGAKWDHTGLDLDAVLAGCTAQSPFGTKGTGPITVACRVFLRSGNRAIISQGTSVSQSSSKDWEIIYWAGKLRFYISSGSTMNYVTSNLSPNLNQWYHVLARWDGTTNGDSMRFWFDGEPDGADIAATDTVKGANFSIGIGGDGASTFSLDGKIKDVLIWDDTILEQDAISEVADPDNYMLSGLIEKVPETKRFFFKEEPPQPTDLRLLHTPKKKYATRPYRFKLNDNHPLSEGLVFAGLGNVAGSESYFDSSVERNHFDGVNSPQWVSALGRQAISLSSASSQYFERATFPNPVDITFACWVYGGGAYDGVFSHKAIGIDQHNIQWHRRSSEWRWQPNGGTFFDSNSLPSTTEWVHTCVVWAPSKGVNQIWFNGVLDASGTDTTALNWIGSNANYIGMYFGDNNSWNGQIADVCIYDHDISPAKITQLANPANFMLSGLIEPLRDPPSYFFTQPTPTEAITGIFEPLVIGV